MKYLLALVLTLAISPSLKSGEKQLLPGLPEGSHVRLGMTIHELVFQFGPPDDTRLAGETDGTYTPSVTDALQVSWNGRDCEFGPQVCTYWATFPPGSATLSRLDVYIDRSGRPTLESLAKGIENQAKVLRYELYCDESDIECDIAECVSPEGEAPVLVVPSIGLDAFIEQGRIDQGPNRIELLAYSLHRLKKGWPDQCVASQ